ncbi:9444_t:CDS:2 [Acaulospora morrowiae]|uniref:9444_t:CDS:1 n=1 Tax=Acaulospora morrowiae TaxID=94023 RepID=A0A9N8V3U8_9GLOM|nr:9444_t:CDS:2 [Acaulospora morrowiae]
MSSIPTQRKKKTEDASSSDISYDNSKEPRKSTSVAKIILKGFLIFIVTFFLSSYLITESWTWGYKNKYTNWKRWIPRKEIIFTEEELAKYDGSDPNLPIYLAMNGEVFDVTAGKQYYGKDSGYNFFAGRDASRAYLTGCFKTHLTHDLRGLTREQIAELEKWTSFYRDHHTYFKVGRVVHPPIDPNTPIPPPCDDASGQKG